MIKPVEPSATGAEEEHLPPLHSTGTPQYGFKPYVEYQQRGRRPNDLGYLVQAIVEQETPIHVDAVIRRFAEIYGSREGRL